MTRRIYDKSDLWHVGIMTRRTYDKSDLWYVGLTTSNRISELQWRVWLPQSELVLIKKISPVDPWSPMPRYRELQKSKRLAISAEGQGMA